MVAVAGINRCIRLHKYQSVSLRASFRGMSTSRAEEFERGP